jgi:hypothetical protein
MILLHTVMMTQKKIHTDLRFKKKSKDKFIFGPNPMYQGNTQSQITLPLMVLNLFTPNLVQITF